MAGAAALKVGEGFGTWLIPVIIFGALGFVAVMSLIVLACVHFCRPRRKIIDQEPETTYETYRTPTISYKDPSLDRPADPNIGRFITHSRSLHVPRNQLINGHRLRPQVSSPELRNTSQPPPYTYRAMLSPFHSRTPRPCGQVYLDEIVVPGHQYRIPQQPQQIALSPGNIPTRPEGRFFVSSPSLYSSTCMSTEEPASAEPFSPPSTPSIFSQESLVPVRTPSWINFAKPRDSDSDSADSVSLFTSSSRNEFSVGSSILDFYGTEEFPTARPRRRSEADGRTGRSWRNNRRLIIVDNNLVGGDSEASPELVEAHTLRRAEVSRLVRGTLEGRVDAHATAASEEKKSRVEEAQVERPPPVGHKEERAAVFKVICPDTSDLWKMPVIPGETLDAFAGRVKQKAGGDVILFMDDEILASERDWKAAKGGGRIVAHLIR